MTISRSGYVYILTSRECASIKIGRTETTPVQRLREINADRVYKPLGPWMLYDVAMVDDCVDVETYLHRQIRGRRNMEIERQRELFDISPQVASSMLRSIDPEHLVGYPKLQRCFFDSAFADYLTSLYRLSGLFNWRDLQESWTLSIFTKTGGGRYFTINIGPHEVAFSSTPGRGRRQGNFLVVDPLILEFRDVRAWLQRRDGDVGESPYESALERAVTIEFRGDFAIALEFLALPGVKRALIAYWMDALITMADEGRRSAYARYHNWNAAAELELRRVGARSSMSEPTC